MALVFNSRRLCLDSNGNPVSGAKLYVYNATTVVLASLFTSATLATPLSNPVVADSSGVFPQIHMAEGAIVDTQTFTSGGVHLSNLDELSVVALGSNTGTFTRDFSNSRFQVRGSGGVVYVEAGDPVGDDVGGKLRLGGWNATQADTLALDAAATSVTGALDVTGAFTVAGNAILTTLSTGALSGASTVIPLTAGLRAYTLELAEAVPSANAALSLTASTDGGLNYLAGTNYSYHWVAVSATTTEANSSAAASFPLTGTGNFANTAGKQNTVSIEIDTPLSGTFDSKFRAQTHWGGAGSDSIMFTNGALQAQPRITHVKITLSAGTFSTGRYRLISRGL